MALPSLDPFDAFQLKSRGRRVREQAEQGRAIGGLQNKQIDAKRRFDLGTLQREFGLQREALPGQFHGRGIQGSGIYARGLKNLATERQRAEQELGDNFQRQKEQLYLQGLQLAGTERGALKDLFYEGITRRQSIAAALNRINAPG